MVDPDFEFLEGLSRVEASHLIDDLQGRVSP